MNRMFDWTDVFGLAYELKSEDETNTAQEAIKILDSND